MSTLPPRPGHDQARPGPDLPPDLAARLHALRDDIAPASDLWPGIAARLADQSAPAAPARRRSIRRPLRRRDAGYAAAAAVVLAVAVGWQLMPVRPPVGPVGDPANIVATGAAADADAPLLRAADALAREYQGALREVRAVAALRMRTHPATTATAADGTAGLDAELERSAAEVRAALARDPDALHLFHRLQRIYAHRLSLNLRQA